MSSQSGFTLIELVLVIIIVAVLAAIAIPHFIQVIPEARYASLKGMQANITSAVTLIKSRYLLDGNTINSNKNWTTTREGVVVRVIKGHGHPRARPDGLRKAMRNWGGWVVTYIPATLTQPRKILFQFTGLTNNCHLIYNEDTGEATITYSGC